MPEVASVYQGIQLGAETTAGVAVSANRVLRCTGFEPTVNLDNELYIPMGNVHPTTQVLNKEWVTGDIDGRICPNDLVYLLSSLFTTTTPTTPSGATNTRRWTIKPGQSSPDTPKTFTMEKGSSVIAQRMAHVLVQSLTLQWALGEASVSGSFIGKRIEENATLTGSPTEITEAILDATRVSVYIGNATTTNQIQTITITGTPTGGTFTLTHEGNTTAAIAFNANAAAVTTALEALLSIGAGNITVGGGPGPGTPWTVTFANQLASVENTLLALGTNSLTGGTAPTVAVTQTQSPSMTKLLRCRRVQIAIPDRYIPHPTLNAGEPSFSFVVQQTNGPTGEIELMHDSVSAALMADFRNGQTKWIRVNAYGKLIEANFAHRVRITMPARITGSDRGDADGIYANTYPFGAIYDSGLASAIEFMIDSNVATL